MTGGVPGDGPAVLRPMRWWDIPPVHALETRLFPEDAWSEGLFWSELAGTGGPDRTRHYVVAEVTGGDPAEPAGYAGLAVTGETADVQTIAVAPEHQGAGLGALLLRHLLDTAAAAGCAEVFLEVRHDNERAQRLYRRHGFVSVGVRPRYYQPGDHDALVMRRAGHGAAAPTAGAGPERNTP